MNKEDSNYIEFYVLIPAYNEGQHIRELLNRVNKYCEHIFVVDDGSRDKTLDILKSMGVEYLAHESNQGKGASLSEGCQYLSKKNIGYVLTMDGDGQHSPDDIPKFIECARKTRADIVVGNRMGNTNDMPLDRYLTNKFTSWVVSRMAGQDVPDSQCGFRLIGKKVLQSLVIESKNYDAETELLIKAGQCGFKIESIETATIYGSQKSKINKIKDTIRFFKLIFRLMKNHEGKARISA